VDRIVLDTRDDYVQPLARFFQSRERRRKRRQ
jgi:hypothetical protein